MAPSWPNWSAAGADATMGTAPVVKVGAVDCPGLRPGFEEDTMGKTGRKRRGRKKKNANHGKRPNA
jgi:hypothetical protein